MSTGDRSRSTSNTSSPTRRRRAAYSSPLLRIRPTRWSRRSRRATRWPQRSSATRRPEMRAGSASGDDDHAQLGLELLAGLGAERAPFQTAVAEQSDHRDALRVVGLREAGLLVDV